jgi:hypothetical protein
LLDLFTEANKTSAFADYAVAAIPSSIGKKFIIKHHYSKGVHNGPMCFGLLKNGELVGVCAFAAPSSENVRASLFGEEYKDSVTELHRLVLLDEVPKNAESFFIVRALRELKKQRPYYKAVVSFADPTQNHLGIIYQATNALFCGQSAPAVFYLDENNRLRHPRQNGKNITAEIAREYGWRPTKREGKYRYVYFLAENKTELKEIKRLFKLESLPYPKAVDNSVESCG